MTDVVRDMEYRHSGFVFELFWVGLRFNPLVRVGFSSAGVYCSSIQWAQSISDPSVSFFFSSSMSLSLSLLWKDPFRLKTVGVTRQPSLSLFSVKIIKQAHINKEYNWFIWGFFLYSLSIAGWTKIKTTFISTFIFLTCHRW